MRHMGLRAAGASAAGRARAGEALRMQETQMIKRLTASMLAAAVLVFALPHEADARRFGGGASSGMQRNLPARSAADAPATKPGNPAAAPKEAAQPSNAAAPAAQATAATASAVGKRSWLGPVAGLAAAVGLVALLSHLGLGEAVAEFVMLALLVAAAMIVVRWLLRRPGPAAAQAPRPAWAGAGASSSAVASAPLRQGATLWREALPAAATAAATMDLPAQAPAGFDRQAFERIAKAIFIRMQAANDSADLDDLRRFTTPQLFAAVEADLRERGASAQTTDVVRVDAEVLDVAQEDARQIVSVRFHGLMREDRDAPAQPFDEIWHLVKPVDDSHAWAIAGIQQQPG
jgi:predicted lipid-binding transport protein (Tim44 family)